MVSEIRSVVQFSTGNVGRHSLAAIIGRPDLELVGASIESREGGTRRRGVVRAHRTDRRHRTSDVDALLALNADCVV
jgi:hypothetical protein